MYDNLIQISVFRNSTLHILFDLFVCIVLPFFWVHVHQKSILFKKTRFKVAETWPQSVSFNFNLGSIDWMFVGVSVGCLISFNAGGYSWLSAMQFRVCCITQVIGLYTWELHCTNPMVQKSIFLFNTIILFGQQRGSVIRTDPEDLVSKLEEDWILAQLFFFFSFLKLRSSSSPLNNFFWLPITVPAIWASN